MNGIVFNGNRNGESLHRYSQFAFMINYPVNTYTVTLWPGHSRLHYPEILLLCSLFPCPSYPPLQMYKPSPPLEREIQKQSVSNLPQCHPRLQVTGLPSAQNKVRIKHLANICMVPRSGRFVHLLTEVHSVAEKINQFNSTSIYQAPV